MAWKRTVGEYKRDLARERALDPGKAPVQTNQHKEEKGPSNLERKVAGKGSRTPRA